MITPDDIEKIIDEYNDTWALDHKTVNVEDDLYSLISICYDCPSIVYIAPLPIEQFYYYLLGYCEGYVAGYEFAYG